MFISESCVLLSRQGFNAGFAGLLPRSPSFWKRHLQAQLRFCLRGRSGVEEGLEETHPAGTGRLKYNSPSYRTLGTISL